MHVVEGQAGGRVERVGAGYWWMGGSVGGVRVGG